MLGIRLSALISPLAYGALAVAVAVNPAAAYDGDKQNAFHKTKHYQVQVGWWERAAKGPEVAGNFKDTADGRTHSRKPKPSVLNELPPPPNPSAAQREFAPGSNVRRREHANAAQPQDDQRFFRSRSGHILILATSSRRGNAAKK